MGLDTDGTAAICRQRERPTTGKDIAIGLRRHSSVRYGGGRGGGGGEGSGDGGRAYFNGFGLLGQSLLLYFQCYCKLTLKVEYYMGQILELLGQILKLL